MKNKNGLIVGVVIVAAVVAFAAWKGLIPPKSGVEGTIGGAERYQAEQISEADVALKDPEVQTFLQSDLFRKMASNPEFAKTVQEAWQANALGRSAELAHANEAAFVKLRTRLVEMSHENSEAASAAVGELAEALAKNGKTAEMLAGNRDFESLLLNQKRVYSALLQEAMSQDFKNADALIKYAKSNEAYKDVSNSEAFANLVKTRFVLFSKENLPTQMDFLRSKGLEALLSKGGIRQFEALAGTANEMLSSGANAEALSSLLRNTRLFEFLQSKGSDFAIANARDLDQLARTRAWELLSSKPGAFAEALKQTEALKSNTE